MVIINVIVVLVLLGVIYLLGRPIVRGAIYFPTSHVQVDIMVRMASLRRRDRVADLGSGDGRLLIACARRGIRAEGYEINPILIFLSRRRIRQAGVKDLAAVHWKSFWRVDLAPYNVVFVYGIPYIMDGLRRKLERELRPGTKVISNAFLFPGWFPSAKEGKISLYTIKPQ
jgi:SAM-dependent methyltransferase